MTEHPPENRKPKEASERACPVEKTPDTASQDSVISNLPNQSNYEKAFSVAHANDIRPSDPALIAALPNETLEQFKERVAKIQENAFGFSGELRPEDLGRKPARKPDVIAIRDDYLNRSEFRKPEPKDGDNLSLKQILDDYRTPFIDAYERSKKLTEGEPGKSKTLEEIVERLKDCPWTDKIRLKFDSKAHNPDYDNFESTITIKPQDPAWKQIDTFAHEGYHATHQTLGELFVGSNPASLPEFLRVKGNAEVNSFETEIRVHKELQSPGIVSYEWSDAQRQKQPAMNLEALYSTQGRNGLAKFLLFDANTDMEINGAIQVSNYHQYHESRYAAYVNGHPIAHKSLMDWMKRDPSVEKKILQGHY